MKNANTTVATGATKGHVIRGFALGAGILAASGGSALAQGAPAAQPHTSAQTVVSENEARTPVPSTAGDKTVVVPRAPADRPAQAPGVAPAPQATAVAQPAQPDADEEYVELLKGSIGWIDLPTDVVGFKTNAAYTASMKGSIGWIDLPTNVAGFQDEKSFTDAMTASFGWPDTH